MSDWLIETHNLTKTYPVRGNSGLTSLFRRTPRPVQDHTVALNLLNLQLQQGEILGLIGANGAGKSTTIKLVTGILRPTAGTVRVFGKDPTRERSRNAYRFGIVMGQRSQLFWDLPAIESLELYRRMYGVQPHQYTRMLRTLSDLLDLQEFLDRPVRQLSLGQRMRCELAVALLHEPEVLFLDEPTIGIDVLAKRKIIDFVRQINEAWGVTVLLTTHNLADMERIAQRVLILDRGTPTFDGTLARLRRLDARQHVEVELREPLEMLYVRGARVVALSPTRFALHTASSDVVLADLIAQVAVNYSVADISIVRPDIDELISRIYAGEVVEPTPA
ncbi:ATP-binding cassette domain-containing protein [Deinococcus sp. QL22]|uniref:ABC transporter ATP-binding protein n=1 Tax=Deinococcus sp. QL22 TaxID=2939437 RepID=UPI00201764AA|nr:ATP-binding cassette domain-containing protein [Deinococcus sp. QL22]UQN07958.1 ATP-binding cassette domain-containing protein [Deinococcus sp. QL22]